MDCTPDMRFRSNRHVDNAEKQDSGPKVRGIVIREAISALARWEYATDKAGVNELAVTGPAAHMPPGFAPTGELRPSAGGADASRGRRRGESTRVLLAGGYHN